MKSATCRISKQGMLQPSNLLITVTLTVNPEGKRVSTWNISYPPPKGAPEETGGESRDAGPSQLRYISKEWFQGTQTLAPFHTDESTKFLNLRCLVFFNQQ